MRNKGAHIAFFFFLQFCDFFQIANNNYLHDFKEENTKSRSFYFSGLDANRENREHKATAKNPNLQYIYEQKCISISISIPMDACFFFNILSLNTYFKKNEDNLIRERSQITSTKKGGGQPR